MKQLPSYSVLEELSKQAKERHLASLFSDDTNRFEAFNVKLPGLVLDYSKQNLTSEERQSLFDLAEEAKLSDWIEKLFNGEKVNHTEGRAAGHTFLRDLAHPKSEVSEQWAKMEQLVDRVHTKQLRGYSGKAITDVVNIGVGGSDLGPLMVTHALKGIRSPLAPELHFVSTLDGKQLQRLLKSLSAETTLFIIASKSFTTIDTQSLATTAKEWIEKHSSTHAGTMQHFIGVSTNAPKMKEWGLLPEHQLLFWDWVGGRFSLWSTIGLTIALQQGMEGFNAFLQGAHEMDVHFRTTPFKDNVPVTLGLISVWNINFLNLAGQAILPYDSRLKYLASYLEQLVMESNGKHVNRKGEMVDYRTCPILWGEVGPNAQHAFYQLMHQGTERVMSDFILYAEVVRKNERNTFHHNLNIANCLAQSSALMVGKTDEDPNKDYPGGQVSNTLLFDKLDAKHLGMMIALYEHSVFVQSVIWDINPFDQWGVELGKKIALEILQKIEDKDTEGLDSSTQGILKSIWNVQNEN
ncbi:glucose-6-phosphate isomerase [Thiomicrorhabdus sp. Milos-T2]|uniref:glucose-6-phosphate isomerase n=1 Tax=Thiomicrorhabdus sp. Milos-T2 TaxID=90814 RepID=UPI000494DA1E|nr:glucose-6-phosphate isomerase [Thiomicrorhabdus sp. Milos-T2]